MKKLIILILVLGLNTLESQDLFDNGRISGNFESYGQYNFVDSTIGAESADEVVRSNSYFYLLYNSNNIDVGIRYEAYLNELVGYDERYRGNGLSHRFATYRSDLIDITVGHFYEQFGSGMILRTYEERLLGIDNAFDGLRFVLRPYQGVQVKGLVGQQRNFWEKGKGLARGIDFDFDLNSMFNSDWNIQYNFGASAVSKYQKSFQSSPIEPENIFAYSVRGGVIGSNFSADLEYMSKINDPNAINGQTYSEGKGLLFLGSFFTKGLSFTLNYHWIDNIDFRTDRAATGQELTLNFMPPLTRQQTYALATIFPFATQPNGEMGIQADLTFKLSRKSFLGGKYGTTVALNYSQVNSINKQPVFNEITNSDGTQETITYSYNSDMFDVDFGTPLFFREFNLDINKRWSKKFKSRFSLIRALYDRNTIEGKTEFGNVNSTIAVLEGTAKINKKQAFRFELQHMWSEMDSIPAKQDNQNGNWGMILGEYTISPHWYFTLFNMINYDNQKYEIDEADPTKRKVKTFSLNYLNGNIAYTLNTTRLSLGYGRFRGGLLCVGGICRQVPPYNGFNMSISTSF